MNNLVRSKLQLKGKSELEVQSNYMFYLKGLYIFVISIELGQQTVEQKLYK